MAKQSIDVRIICSNPPSGNFGLQDKQRSLKQGVFLDEKRLAFDFELTVKQTDAGIPNFTGKYAHGTPSKRFVYLTLKEGDEKIIRRIKVQLGTIQWEQVMAVLEIANSCLQVEVDGRGSGSVPLISDGWIIN